MALAGATWAALAAPKLQSKTPAVKTASSVAAASVSPPVTLSQLPALVAHMGAARSLSVATGQSGAVTQSGLASRTSAAAGTGKTGFNLVETDLTPNSPSDEREPVVSPSGDLITFTSTGADSTAKDANPKGRIDSLAPGGFKHIWIMNRDGSSQRQVTGFGADANRNQSHPTWSPDGNQLAYSDQDDDATGGNTILDANGKVTAKGSQLWIVSALDQNPIPSQRTFFHKENGVVATVESPAWAPSGLSIAYVANYDARPTINGIPSTADGARILPTRDIFIIAPDGSANSITRVTGDATNDPVGNQTDDNNPAWATVNTNVLFFSSNRDLAGKLTGAAANGRRIWRILADGTKANQVTDPTQRAQGAPDDVDDYPAPSIQTFFPSYIGQRKPQVDSPEQLAFQSNSYIDASDQADGPRGRDLNIWSVPIDSASFGAPPPEPRVYVGSYTDGKIVGVNVRTSQVSTVVPRIPANTFSFVPHVEDVVVSADGQYVYAADRDNARIDRFYESDGTPAGNPSSGLAFTPATVTNPTGVVEYNGYLYVASGYPNPGASAKPPTATQTLYRFNTFDGTTAGNATGTTPDPTGKTVVNTTGAFSNGETDANGGTVSNGAEGIAITPEGNYIAVAALIDNKINLYDTQTGNYLFDATTNTSLVSGDKTANGGLNLPTGLAWGPDFNGDGFADLYACSSGDNSIKVYAGPNPYARDSFTKARTPFALVGAKGDTRPGTFLGNLVQSNQNGYDNGLNAPERIKIVDIAKHDNSGATPPDTYGTDGIFEVYVSSFSAPGSTTPGDGYQVLRFELDTKKHRAYSWPAGAGVPAASSSSDAAYISLPVNFNDDSQVTLKGAASFSFNRATTTQLNAVTLPPSADETSGAALVLTNILSSPNNFKASLLPSPQTVDRSADREPSFSRNTATRQTLARVVFASGRKYSPTPDATTPINPSGGDQFNTDGSSAVGVTHDIWITSSRDTTPPALVPQGAGNLQYPVVAPQPDAPFFAPRTAEAGLVPNQTPTQSEVNELTATPSSSANTYANHGGLRFAVVMHDVESGLREGAASRAVTVSFYNADKRQFRTTQDNPNEGIAVSRAEEQKAAIVSINGQTSFSLNVYDDGPVSAGGHEQEAGAVAGDGNYYCEGVLPTPPVGDYYIDVSAFDRAGNYFNYDNVWGFSTRRFVRQGTTSDLFVSDYTCGQLFPFELNTNVRSNNMPPVESYYLDNPGGFEIDAKTGNPIVDKNGAPVGVSRTSTFSNVDVWRVLCRGPVTQDVLNAYRPSIVKQIDPTTPYPGATPTPTPGAGPTATPVATPVPGTTPLPFTQLTRNVAVSNAAVIWAAPYAGSTFVGPGTITDPTTQAALTSFLQDGGRLFLSGRSIAWALSSGGALDNNFLNTELAAKFKSEQRLLGNVITASNNGSFLSNEFNAKPPAKFSGDFVNLEFPYHFSGDKAPDSYTDSATTQDPFFYNYVDILTPQTASGVTVTTDYNAPEGVVGQRIVNSKRNNGLESRAVFFGFGFEAINRRYTANGDYPPALDTRFRLGRQILQYFKTSGVSGTVTNTATNLPVPNFLVRVDGPGGPYFARTDARGQYSVTGLSTGRFTASAYLDSKNLTSPQGFFGVVGIFDDIVGGGAAATGLNLAVTPAVPGAVIGRAVSPTGAPLPNLPVLIKSIGQSSIFPNGGQFVRLGFTNASGIFSFANVPAQAEMQVIFNPKGTDIPAGSNVNYDPFKQRLKTVGYRVLPEIGGKRPSPIIVPSGDNFYLNDVDPDTTKNEGPPIVVGTGSSIAGTVSINSAPVAGATVQLLNTDSSGNPTTVTSYPVQTSGTGGVTGAEGRYTFTGIKASAIPTKYAIKVSVPVPTGGTSTFTLSRTAIVTLAQGDDPTQNFDFVLGSLTGNVVTQSDNKPAVGATVSLQNADGSPSLATAKATTDAGGVYTIANVPTGDYTYDATSKSFVYSPGSGKSVTYAVFAVLGVQSGSQTVSFLPTAAFPVKVPTIAILNQQLAGTVSLQTISASGTTTANFAGATVELLDANGNSFATPRTTISASDGSYLFPGIPAGTYKVRASANGDSTTSDAFTTPGGAFQGPTLTLVQSVISGTVVDTASKPVAGVTVSLSQNGTVLESKTTGADGTFAFSPVGAGSGYLVNAVKTTQSGSKAVPTFARGTAPASVVITLKTTPLGAPVGPTFSKGQTYAISVPFATSTNAAARNSFDRSGADATVPLAQAFNYGPTTTNAAGQTVQLYTVQRFNPNTLVYETIPNTGNLVRGEGYLLKVIDVPASGQKLRFATPADDPTLVGLATTGAPTFTVNLVYNGSTVNNPLNGRNFIGFGFDPTLYDSVVWDTDNTTTDPAQASVNVVYSGNTYTLRQAVARRLILSTLTTLDGTTGRSVATNRLVGFGGYFVTARTSGVQLVFQNPQNAPNTGTTTFLPYSTYVFSVPFAATGDATSTVAISAAFSPSGANDFTIYKFDAANQKNNRALGKDFLPVTGALQRGVGYILKTGATPLRLNTDGATLNATTFSVTLVRNTNFKAQTRQSNSTNGYNLIAFPFDPFTIAPVPFSSAQVRIGGGNSISLTQATAAGILSDKLYTVDAKGVLTPVPAGEQVLRPFRAYFVQIYRDNVTLTFSGTTN